MKLLRWILYALLSLGLHFLVLLYITGEPLEEKKENAVEFQFLPSVQVLAPKPPEPIKVQVPVQETSDAVEVTEEEPEPEPEAPPPEPIEQEGPVVERSYVPFYAVDSRPTYTLKSAIVFPVIEKKRQQSAVVIVEVDIDENGILQGLRIVKSAGKNFDAAVIDAMRSASFTPGIQKGQAVPVRTRFTIKFQLE